MAIINRAGQSKVRNQELVTSLSQWCRSSRTGTSSAFSGHQQGPGLEVELIGLDLTPIRHIGASCGGLIYRPHH